MKFTIEELLKLRDVAESANVYYQDHQEQMDSVNVAGYPRELVDLFVACPPSVILDLINELLASKNVLC